jgi:hypothetical protein
MHARCISALDVRDATNVPSGDSALAMEVKTRVLSSEAIHAAVRYFTRGLIE